MRRTRPCRLNSPSRRIKLSGATRSLTALRVAAAALVVHPARLGVRASVAAIVARRRARALAARVLVLIVALRSLHDLSSRSRLKALFLEAAADSRDPQPSRGRKGLQVRLEPIGGQPARF